MFTRDQIETFYTAGYVRLPNAVPQSDVATMCDRVWALMEKQGIQRDDPTTWRSAEHTHRGLNAVSKLRELRDGEPSPEDYPVVREALDSAFAPVGRKSAVNWGQTLVTLPIAAEVWLLPSSIWHFDHAYLRPADITGVNVFLLINDVEPGGGGTAVLRNSPLIMDRLLRAGARFAKISDQNKGFCNSHPWLRGLKVAKKAWTAERNTRYMQRDTDIEGVPARVEELTGAAGDVFVCHPALLHAPAMNASDRPRLMRTQRVYAKTTQD